MNVLKSSMCRYNINTTRNSYKTIPIPMNITKKKINTFLLIGARELQRAVQVQIINMIHYRSHIRLPL
jgi:hypothetical protein